MKIRILGQKGILKAGDIVEAVLSPHKNYAAVFDTENILHFFNVGEFEIFVDPAPEITWKSQEIQTTVATLRDIIGQDLARIEFK